MVNDLPTPAARRLISKFGGLSRMAVVLDKPVTTIQRWWESGAIRPKHHSAILDAAVREQVRLEVKDFVDFDVKHDAFRPIARRTSPAE